jgi:hypothetical protein
MTVACWRDRRGSSFYLMLDFVGATQVAMKLSHESFVATCVAPTKEQGASAMHRHPTGSTQGVTDRKAKRGVQITPMAHRCGNVYPGRRKELDGQVG